MSMFGGMGALSRKGYIAYGLGGGRLEAKDLSSHPPENGFSVCEISLSLWSDHLNYLIYKGRTLRFAFWKLELDTIYNVYSNESQFKYYITILLGVEV